MAVLIPEPGRRESISLLLAVGAHATAIVWASLCSAPPVAAPPAVMAFDEVDVLPEQSLPMELPEALPHVEHRPRGSVASASVPRSASTVVRTNVDTTAEVPPARPPASPDGLPERSDAPRFDRRGVDLGLDGSISLRGAFAEEPGEQQQRASPESLLRDGLAQADGELGVGRASPMLRVARRLAFAAAPAEGTAILEIVTDKNGVVQSVQVAGRVVDRERWQHVANALLQELAGQRLQPPAGANGEVTTIRIDRGAFAQPPSARSRTKRRAAVGQDPQHPRSGVDESTRASFETGQLAPTLGGRVGGGDAPATKVVLLGSRPL